MNQTKLADGGYVLNEDGTLRQSGYANKCVVTLNRECIAGSSFRIKEWDFYQVSNGTHFCQLTIGHASYAGTANFTLCDMRTGEKKEVTVPLLLPFDKLKLPRNADEKGTVSYQKKGYCMSFKTEEGKRTLSLQTKTKKYGEVRCVFELSDRSEGVLVITPFEKPHQFYFNYKINCMAATGYVAFGGDRVEFCPTDSFGLIDWGRGVLPFEHKWWWGNASMRLADGKLFGFNIGVFGKAEKATENMLFYDNKAHKLDEVFVEKDENDWMREWVFSSSDKRFEMKFTPVYDNHTKLKVLFAHNECHQVYGKFSGTAVLSDGTILDIDDMMGFCEFAHNHW